MKKFTTLAVLLAFLSSQTYAAKITNDTLDIGKPGSSENVNVRLGDSANGFSVLRRNRTSGIAEISDDGISFRRVGSGGGGSGINILQDGNFDFEQGGTLSPAFDGTWTASGGAISAETSAPLFGDTSVQWDASAMGQTLSSNAIAIPVGLRGGRCLAGIYYLYEAGTAGDLSLRAYDGTNVVAAVPLELTTGVAKFGFVTFDCPDSGNLILQLYANVADPDAIDADQAHLGSNIKEVDVSGAELVASAFYPTTANCSWNIISTSFIDYPSDSDCPAISVLASTYPVDATDNNLPDIDFDSLPPGIYVVKAIGNFVPTVAQFGSWRISDGTTNGETYNYQRTDAGTSDPQNQHEVMAVFTYTDSGARNFKLQAKNITGGGSATIANAQDDQQHHWWVWRYPLAPQSAVSIEAANFEVKATISGGSPSMGTSTVGTPTGLQNSALTATFHKGAGQIACGASASSSSTTCTGDDEAVGFTVNVPATDDYTSCFKFSHTVSLNASSSVSVASSFMQRQTVAFNDLTEVATGENRSNDGVGDVGSDGNGDNFTTPHGEFCETFTLQAGLRTIRLFYIQAVSGTVNTSVLAADGTNDSRVHWTLRRGKKSGQLIQFDNLITTNPKSGAKVVAAELNCDGSSAILQNPGSWVDSIGNISSGQCIVDITSAGFGSTAICTSNSSENVGNTMYIRDNSATSITVDCVDSGGSPCSSWTANVICYGAN